MRKEEIRTLVEGTSDPAFAVDGEGLVSAWNEPAERLFGISAEQAIGSSCGSVVKGADECGLVCSENCTIQQAVRRHQPMANFDLQVQTVGGQRWCNVSILIADSNGSATPQAIHIMRPVDLRKRLEMVVRDFVVGHINVPAEQAVALIASPRATGRDTDLSKREIEILKLLAKGGTTINVAGELHISRTTVNNHVQHILHKLDAHSRLEAIRRAEHAGLI